MNWFPTTSAKAAELTERAQLRLGPLRASGDVQLPRFALRENATPSVKTVPRINPNRRGALLIVGLAAVLAIAGLSWWQFRPTTEPVPLVSAQTPSPSNSKPAQLVVAVSGSVHKPGLVRLPPESRVVDAIDAAGGLLPDAKLGNLNLARKLRDGELVIVGGAAVAGTDTAGTKPGAGALVDLNTATMAQLDELPGVGPVLAGRIIDYRATHGGFASVDELGQVDGVGETRIGRLKDLVTV